MNKINALIAVTLLLLAPPAQARLEIEIIQGDHDPSDVSLPLRGVATADLEGDALERGPPRAAPKAGFL